MTEKAERDILEILAHTGACIEAHGARLTLHSRVVGEIAADNLETKRDLHRLTEVVRNLHADFVHYLDGSRPIDPRLTGQ